MAYAENKFLPSKRSAGGNEGEGVQVYFTCSQIRICKIIFCRVTQQLCYKLPNH